MKKFLSILLVAGLILIGVNNMAEAKQNTWDKTFPKSDKVNIQKVSFKNRYGIELVGDLYTPKDAKGKMAAIAVSGPFGAVKEQVSGRYAQTMAERGFVTLAFDPSFTGESKGEPRNVASPDINTEDFSAAVDFLSVQDNVEPEKIGVIGICGFGGFGLNAAAIDTRIKATATITMYDMTRVSAKGYNDTVDENARYEMKVKLNKQRTEDFRNILNGGTYAKTQGLPDIAADNMPLFLQEYIGYYKNPKRGFHERSIGSNSGWNTTSSLSLINMPILMYSNEIRTPVLMVHGEKAHSRYFSEDAFKNLTGDNKELYIVEGANHVDLYDNLEKIPFDKIESFFKSNLEVK